MLLNILNIVLRETLEASVLVGLLMAVSTRLGITLIWIAGGLVLGGAGAALYAANLATITQWFDYVGQEVINASLQYLIFLCLLMISILLAIPSRRTGLILALMLAALALAITREGAEVLVFYFGYLQTDGNVFKSVISGSVGLLIGVSVGVLVYYVVRLVPMILARWIEQALLLLIGSGMVLQATQLMQQADWFKSTSIAWNSNWLLPENSIFGQLIYAVFGYEATPSMLEVWVYIFSSILFLITPIAMLILRRSARNE